jgi:hypothetical protein
MRGTIDGHEIYLPEDELPAFTLSVNSLTDPSKVQGTSSSTMKVVATKEARQKFGTEFMDTVMRGTRPRLLIGDDSAGLFQADVVPVTQSRDVIECLCVGGNASWFDYARAEVLQEHNWQKVDPEKPWGRLPGPLITATEIIANWGAQSPGSLVYWPLVDHGNYMGEADTFDVEVDMIRPGVRIGSAIFWALRDGGWHLQVKGKRAVQEFYKYIEYGDTDKVTAVTTQLSGGGLALTMDALSEQYEYKVVGTRPDPFPFPGTVATGWTGFPDFFFTTQENGAIHPSVKFLVPYTDDPSFQGRSFRIVLWDDTDGVEIAGAWTGTVDPAMTVAGELVFEGSLGSGYVPEGHDVFIGILVDEAVAETVDMPNSNTARLDFESNYQLNRYLVLGSLMPKGTLATLMTNIAKARGYVYSTTSDGVVEVWADEEYFRKPDPGTPIRDWTDRVDHNEAPVKNILGRPQSFEIKYSEDDEDQHLSRINRITRGMFGKHFETIANGTSAAISIELPWAPSFMGTRFGGCMIPVITKTDYDPAEDINYKIQPRLLVDDGTAPGTWTFNGSSKTAYPRCYFVLPAAEKQVPMAFGTPYLFGGGQDTVIAKQLQQRTQIQRSGQYLRTNLFIRDHELQDFDHGLPTLVDDGSGPAWYWVQEIQQHRFGVHQPTKCLLVQIPGKEVAIVQPEQPAITYPDQPFACSGPGYISFVIGPGTGLINMDTSSGYFSVRASNGTITTYPSLTDVELSAGTYCVWTSDELGALAGEFTNIQGIDDIAEVDLSGIEGMSGITQIFFDGTLLEEIIVPLIGGDVSINFDSSPITNVVFASGQGFGYISCTGDALTEAAVDHLITRAYQAAVAGSALTAVNLDGGTSAPPSGAVAAYITALTGGPNMSITGTGLASTDGDYDPQADINGRSAYIHAVNGITEVFWTGAQWRSLAVDGIYDSYDDVLEPWLVTTWILVSGSGSLPTVIAPGYGVTVTTN